MLQRAASNAYSWWWASHIRTKQSKWLEQSLQDMEEKVHYMLKLIEEDGDSFAKRAEMYYKKRPELISFVEEAYRAFRALAERYDHLSTELQNANNKIATVFPEEVQYAIDEEDEYNNYTRNGKKNSTPNGPKVPKAPNKDLKGLLPTVLKKIQGKKSSKTPDTNACNNAVAKSGLSKNEALEEIDKLQKDILGLQTKKEFVKSSYEKGLKKFWEIENQITERQQRVCTLQDEFGIAKVIEDEEARTLMAEVALKSCEETLSHLLEKQEACSKEAREEFGRIEDARERLKSLRHKFGESEGEEEFGGESRGPKSPDRKIDGVEVELEVLQEKMEYFETGSNGSLTVTELAEKIDELVNKVISLELAVSSQTSLINRLRTETGDLQAQIRILEDDKEALIDGTYDLSNRLKEMEGKLHGIQDLNHDVENQRNHLQTHFTEARCSLDHLSVKLYNVKLDEEQEEEEAKFEEESEKEKNILNSDNDFGSSDLPRAGEDKKEKDVCLSGENRREIEETDEKYVEEKAEEAKGLSLKTEEARDLSPKTEARDLSPKTEDKLQKAETGEEAEIDKEYDEPNWKEMLLSGLEDREKILLTEYTATLRNYKQMKKKLTDVEKKNRDGLFEMTVQLRELSNAITRRDEEIQSLREKVNVVQESLGGSTDKDSDCSISDSRNLVLESRGNEVEDIKLILINQPQTLSPVEERLRLSIDAILDENLDFWLRFSTAFHQVQKFKTSVQDLLEEISSLKERKNRQSQLGSIISEVKPIYKHLREIQTELLVWLEQSTLLRDELQCRFSSLCRIQEEITVALKEGVEEEEIKFSSHQAAKLQGEVLNMKQENNKVREELQAGYDHVTALQFEIGKTLSKLDDEFELSGSKNHEEPQLRHSNSRPRIPLSSFIFGSKPKKQRNKLFACVHPSRNSQDWRARLHM